MAESGERRMLFDTRGRRRNVIRVVYVLLALLMGGSLFLTVGPFNLGEIAGTGGGGDAAEVFEDRAERIEERLAKNPNDEGTLLSLAKTQIEAGRAKTDIDPQTGLPGFPPADAQDLYDEAMESWERYVRLSGDQVNPAAAQLVAQTYFGLAERGSVSFTDVQENIDIAVRAQRIAATAQPNAGSLSSLAIYEYFDGNFKAGDEAAKRAVALAPKAEAKNAEKQLDRFRKQAERYVAQRQQFEKAEETGKAGGGAGDFQNPFGGFGAGTPGAPAE
jgi:tetratricopeptide (TPR) repeat protein